MNIDNCSVRADNRVVLRYKGGKVPMTAKEVEACVKDIKKFTKKVTSTKAKAREFLAETGVYTKKGKLNRNYK